MLTSDYIFSGTLGDAFIVGCKLASINDGRIKRLYRLSNWPQMDPVIDDMFSLFGDWQYGGCVSGFASDNERIRIINETGFKFVDASWDNSTTPNQIINALNIEMSPFPIFLPASNGFSSTQKTVGIQVHTGKQGGNHKFIDEHWILNFCQNPSLSQTKILLFGNVQEEKFNYLEEKLTNVTNLVGKLTLQDWFNSIARTNVFITPDGISAYYALSQKVQTYIFHFDPHVTKSIHPKWQQYCNLFNVSSNVSLFSKAYSRLRSQKMNGLIDPKNIKGLEQSIINTLEIGR